MYHIFTVTDNQRPDEMIMAVRNQTVTDSKKLTKGLLSLMLASAYHFAWCCFALKTICHPIGLLSLTLTSNFTWHHFTLKTISHSISLLSLTLAGTNNVIWHCFAVKTISLTNLCHGMMINNETSSQLGVFQGYWMNPAPQWPLLEELTYFGRTSQHCPRKIDTYNSG